MRPEPRGDGTVNIVTPGGWAEVRLRGRRVGQAPGRITLAEGRHVLELLPNGSPPVRRVPVTVRAGEVTRISVPLR